MSRTEKDPLQKKLEIRNWIVLAALSAAGWLIVSAPFGLGILLGGLISIANFYGLYLSLRKAFSSVSDKSKSVIMVRYYFRFAVTAVILYFLMTRFEISVIGLVLGLSVVVINILLTTLIELSKKNGVLRVKEVV
ncbi:MAG: ATP synthase subunit I [Syntrophales bacterium]|nr:ATP synthase subunit I [Syntrophales bacterium]MDD5233784.1 ATP synthase subunit I [Syntrophales bacterium]MDD5532528.1 ATP synthase subunit I [Syntrophales bacterium]